MTTGRNHYEVLGLEIGATDAEIRRKYRQLALKLHPDKALSAALREKAKKSKESPGNEEFKLTPQEEKDVESVNAQFNELQTAYETLGDVNRRKKYDELCAAGDQAQAKAQSQQQPKAQSQQQPKASEDARAKERKELSENLKGWLEYHNQEKYRSTDSYWYNNQLALTSLQSELSTFENPPQGQPRSENEWMEFKSRAIASINNLDLHLKQVDAYQANLRQQHEQARQQQERARQEEQTRQQQERARQEEQARESARQEAQAREQKKTPQTTEQSTRQPQQEAESRTYAGIFERKEDVRRPSEVRNQDIYLTLIAPKLDDIFRELNKTINQNKRKDFFCNSELFEPPFGQKQNDVRFVFLRTPTFNTMINLLEVMMNKFNIDLSPNFKRSNQDVAPEHHEPPGQHVSRRYR